MEEKAMVIGNETVQKYLSVEDVIARVEETWKWYGEGKIIMPSKITTDMEPMGIQGWFNSMPSYIGPADMAGIKVVGGYAGNHKLGMPYIKANLLLTDPHTGILRALICGDWISDMRTGAQPAIMAKYLAAKTNTVTIIGAGLQGYTSLLCMSKILNINEVRICDLNADARRSFAARFEGAPFKMVDCSSNEEGCKDSDVIITVTTANAALVLEPWVKKGALVMTMGSFKEVDYEVVRKADMLAVDHVGQALHRGNFKDLAEMGEVTADSFGAVMPDVVSGKQCGRRCGEDRICAELVGMGCLDVSIAALLYERILTEKADILTIDMTK